MEPELLPLVDHMLPQIVHNLRDPYDPHLELLRTIAVKLKPLLPHLEAELRSPAFAEAMPFLALLVGAFYPIVVAVRRRPHTASHTQWMRPPVRERSTALTHPGCSSYCVSTAGDPSERAGRAQRRSRQRERRADDLVQLPRRAAQAPRRQRGVDDARVRRGRAASARVRIRCALQGNDSPRARAPLCSLRSTVGCRASRFQRSEAAPALSAHSAAAAADGAASVQVAKKVAAAIHQLRSSVDSDVTTPSDSLAQYSCPQRPPASPA
jgi:hypothetical protein